MKFGFVTCVQLGLSCIEKIYEIGGQLDLLITLNDNKAVKKSGRIYLDDFSSKNKIDLIKINHINDAEAIQAIKDHDIDWLFIIGWSQIANKSVLDAPKKGAIGIHPTLLPEGRGRAAIPWAIIKGLDQTGVSMFKLDEGVDTGKLLGQKFLPLTPKETASSLYNRVNKAHEGLIEQVWSDLVNDSIVLKAQDESKATYWPGRTPADGEINEAMTVEEVDRLVRATTKPYPGAFIMEDGKKIIVWSGSTLQSIGNEESICIKLSNGDYWATNFEEVLE
ncbi:formyltransferase family protein [Marinifilum fragile]|uniref:formyltransferase family protein n=1 Tax=Marinifilum fragile TaxID=570161 RepID=UPI002AAAA4E5|nr:formyltransferase family protein [Marinifilum fragile]